jgi:hypothetical protein
MEERNQKKKSCNCPLFATTGMKIGKENYGILSCCSRLLGENVNKPQEIYHAFMIKNTSQFICVQQSFMFVISFFVFICILVIF